MDRKAGFAQAIADAVLAQKGEIDAKQVESLIAKPKEESHGDLAFPCFVLAKSLKKAPAQIAQSLASALKLPDGIAKVEAVGPYLNAFMDKEAMAAGVLACIADGSLFAAGNTQQSVLIEFPSPNTNKPLHLGHLRNMLLGKSLGLLLERGGNEVIRVNLNNDRGIAICKTMLAYEKFAQGETPESTGIKSDYLVGKYYVRYQQEAQKDPSLDEQAQAMLQQWEEGDVHVRKLWELINGWALQGHNRTYERFGITHDKVYNESDIYQKGSEIVKQFLEKGVFSKDEKGNIICNLEDIGLDTKVVLRADGTSVYITQDIILALEKQKDFAADRYVFIVGNEQIYHFKVLFEILHRIGFGEVDKNIHYSYGMIELPEGKMKSRQGNVVEADELADEVIARAADQVKQRSPDIDATELDERARKIGMGALAFFILKYNPQSDFTFFPDESLSFEGETGPYVQYTYARIQSILRKAGENPEQEDLAQIGEDERLLLRIMEDYQGVVVNAIDKMRPSEIAHYLIALCKQFNEFYHKCPIIKAQKEVRIFRLNLIDSVSHIIADGLSLLGIEILEEM